MYWETKKFTWLTLLWYLLYCGVLELNLQYLPGMPVSSPAFSFGSHLLFFASSTLPENVSVSAVDALHSVPETQFFRYHTPWRALLFRPCGISSWGQGLTWPSWSQALQHVTIILPSTQATQRGEWEVPYSPLSAMLFLWSSPTSHTTNKQTKETNMFLLLSKH